MISLNEYDDTKVSYLVTYRKDKFLLNIYNSKNKENFLDENVNYKPNDVLKVTAKLSKTQKLNNPYEFDYKMFLNSKNISGQLSTNFAEKLTNSRKINLRSLMYKYKESINLKFIENMDEYHFNFFKSIIYSDDLDLDEAIKENYRRMGVGYILTTSGTHVFYLILVINSILNNKSLKSKIIAFFSLTLFSFLAGQNYSIQRCIISYLLNILSYILKIKVSPIKRNFFALLIMLSYNFFCITNAGLILSFTSVMSIILLSKYISSFFKSKIYRYKKSIFLIILYKLTDMFSVSLCVFIFTFPLQINFFHSFNILSFFYNIIISIVASLEYMLGFLTLFTIFIPFVSDIFINANYIVLDILIKLSNIFSKVTLNIKLSNFSILEIFLYYLSLVFILYKIFHLKRVNISKRRIIKKTINFFLILSIITIFVLQTYRLYFEDYVLFFNVGQGNMALIRQDRKTVLIDMGSTTEKLAGNILESYINNAGIERIDLALVTHFHLDHVNGIYSLDSSKLKIENVAFLSPLEEFGVDDEYEKVIRYADENNISQIKLGSLDELKFKNLKITALIPSNKVILDSDVANANSVIYVVEIKNKKILFMGDATKKTEAYYISYLKSDNLGKVSSLLNNIDIIQIGHHGSNTSTSEEFLEFISPKEAVISSKKSVYGHPSSEVIERLEKLKIKYYITEKEGAIKF